MGTLVRDGDIPYYHLTPIPIRLELEVLIHGQTYEYTLAFEHPENFKEYRVLEEKFAVEGQVVYSREVAQVTFFEQYLKAFILRTSFQNYENDAQIIVTSHNPEAIQRFSRDSNIWILDRKSHSEPAIVRKADEFQISSDLITSLMSGDIHL